MSALIETVRARIAALEAEKADVETELRGIAANPGRGFTSDSDALARVEELRIRGEGLRSDIDEARDRLAQLQNDEARSAAAAPLRSFGVGGAVVRSEPSTYDEHTARQGVSFFRDAFGSQFRNDPRAQERLSRHMTEMERRDITTATMNGLVPPKYLLDQAAMIARAMRPFADVVPGYTLPADGMSFVITRGTTGTATGVQTTQNTAATETDLVTTDLTVSVVTIMGQQDISRQLFERSPAAAPADQLILADLVADYATKLDAQLLTGTGQNGQHLGVLNTSGIETVTYAATTVAAFYSTIASAVNKIHEGRYAPASVITMHPRRWNWLLSKSDPDGRPLIVPNPGNNSNPIGTGGQGYGVVGTMLGLPVVVDANVPTNLGASTDEDRVIVSRMEDYALWEATGGPMTFTFDQTANAPATVRLAVAGFSAFTAGRYPKSTCQIVGTGLAGVTF